VNPALRLRILAVLTAVALVGIAVVHLNIAGNYKGLGSHPLALSDQFYAQAVGGIVLAIALLIRPHALVWLSCLGFAIASLGAITYSRYKCLPIYGFDGCFQESWGVEGARPAAYFEGLAIVLSTIGAALTVPAFLRTRRA
jgi:hypothetical protein